MAAILLIEDDAQHLEFLTDTVEFGGHVAFPAKDTLAADKILDQHRIDYIVTDIVLPGMSGLDFMETLYHQKRLLPFIVVTGCSSEDYRQKARKLKAIDYLIKPIDPEKLLQSLNH